jgi:hypothetical protein
MRKAYDSISCSVLWRVLPVYGVDSQVVDLLADLHTGTQAAVKLACSKVDSFESGCQAWLCHGCIVAQHFV